MGTMTNFSDALAGMEQAYNAVVQEVAGDLIAAIGADYSDSEDWIQGMHELIDGHGWVIYTIRAKAVALVSPNSGRAAEEFGGDYIVENGEIEWSRIAYAALEADVLDAIRAEAVDINDDATFTIAAVIAAKGVDPGDVGEGYETLAHLAAAWIETGMICDPCDWIDAGFVDPDIADAVERAGITNPADLSDVAPETLRAFADGKITAEQLAAAVKVAEE